MSLHDNTASALRRVDLNANPFLQFEQWYKEAGESEILDPTAMTLATVSSRGRPSSRTVLLKDFNQNGFVFFTNYESRKATEIAGNPFVSLLFLWLPLRKQVSIEGRAEKISPSESTRYFNSRPLGNRIGAWTSRQSNPLESRSVLEKRFEKLKEKYSTGKIPIPSFWGGYRVSPYSFEFWQGREDRLHDRFRYRWCDVGSWDIVRLSP
ncbi:MAG: Pyridoxine/pyridoxamine 5'-phosphate oxidase [Candidatus Moanabacter tarae]|uniref:Pyridoxamine 5'-phosphate oxidase n=1 Tax=Candidatus Moanibacter tarae TaxID=2200854 RepID=A0A2Z4AET1_9BACT|nr:MAG: Pyridoxine/pyridoxamine 5'-phosphate oxidase [Candidatus Moanabacter tarae]|tara:strand:- start:32497 stop:33123 length:627 start_codon:yes stop_codon:yes gene_type:complete